MENTEEEEETEADSNDTNTGPVYKQIRISSERRMEKLSHEYAILGWICCVQLDVRKDCITISEKIIHSDVVERGTTKLYAHQVYAAVPATVNVFWKEWRMVDEETGFY